MGFSVPPELQNYPQGRPVSDASVLFWEPQGDAGPSNRGAGDGGEGPEGEGAGEPDSAGLEALRSRGFCPLLSLSALRILLQPLAGSPFLPRPQKLWPRALGKPHPAGQQMRPLQTREGELLGPYHGSGSLSYSTYPLILLSISVFAPDIGLQDRILRTSLLLPISRSLRTSRVQGYCEAARKVRNVNWEAEGWEHRIPPLGPCFMGPLVFCHIVSKWTGHSTAICCITPSFHCHQTSSFLPGWYLPPYPKALFFIFWGGFFGLIGLNSQPNGSTQLGVQEACGATPHFVA